MYRNKYDKLFGQFDPSGVAVRYYYNNKAFYFYILPSDQISDMANNSNFSLVYGYNDLNGDSNVVDLKLKANSRDCFEPIESKSFKYPIWFGGTCLGSSNKTLLPWERYESYRSSKRLVTFRNNLLSVAVNSWPEDLKGKRKLQIDYITYHGNTHVKHDSGKRYSDLLTKNGHVYSLYYENGGLALCQKDAYISSTEHTSILLSYGDGLFQKNGDDVTVDLDAVHKLLTAAKDNIDWFSNHIWRPNCVNCSTQYFKDIRVLTADDIAGATVDKLTKEMLSTYDKAMKQVT